MQLAWVCEYRYASYTLDTVSMGSASQKTQLLQDGQLLRGLDDLLSFYDRHRPVYWQLFSLPAKST